MKPVQFFDLNMGELPTQLPLLALAEMVMMPEGKFSMRLTDIKQISKVFWALSHGRMLGVVQKKNASDLYKTGCAARICGFNENEDDSLTLSLMGVCRFTFKDAFKKESYDMLDVNYAPFASDFSTAQMPQRNELLSLLDSYLKNNHIDVDVDLFDKMEPRRLIATLVSVLPLEGTEKQAIVETVLFEETVRTFLMILRMALLGNLSDKERQKC